MQAYVSGIIYNLAAKSYLSENILLTDRRAARQHDSIGPTLGFGGFVGMVLAMDHQRYSPTEDMLT
jgi:hypothetical protein